MKDQLITFETAKLAKEKGFNFDGNKYHCFYGYNNNKKLYFFGERGNNWNYSKDVLSDVTFYEAPTQSLLQRWLREEHKIHIWCSNNLYGRGFRYTLENLSNDEIVGRMQGGSSPSEGHTYEQALELALQEALKIIK